LCYSSKLKICTVLGDINRAFALFFQAMENHFLRRAALPRGAQEQFRGISICIMDEASQCVEPESLIPLKFGFTKVFVNIFCDGLKRTASPV
jgi:hypothetical protein